MKIKLNYFVIPIITIFTALSGSLLTSGGMGWYKTINLPEIAPAGSFIGSVWTIIFILSAWSVIIFWNKREDNKNTKIIITLFIVNALLNIFWCFLFFGVHLIGWSIIEMILLNLVNLSLIILLWKKYLFSAMLLTPYFIWVSFATYLAYSIWKLNS